MAQQSASNVGEERDDRDRGYVKRFAQTKPSTKTTELIVWALTQVVKVASERPTHGGTSPLSRSVTW